MNIIVISSPNNIKNEIDIIASMFDKGLNYFHLRKPSFSKDNYIDFLREIHSKYHNNIVISNFQELIFDFKLKGVHFSQKERYENKHLSFKKSNYIITTSFHCTEDIKSDVFDWDYYYLGPFFDSISKKGYYKKEFILDDINKKKLIALGGITYENINTLEQKHIENVALLGTIWSLFQ